MAKALAVLYPLCLDVSLSETKRNERTSYQSPIDDIESPLTVYKAPETFSTKTN
jgi:hypothetical protein